jgi:hypothetical protein
MHPESRVTTAVSDELHRLDAELGGRPALVPIESPLPGVSLRRYEEQPTAAGTPSPLTPGGYALNPVRRDAVLSGRATTTMRAVCRVPAVRAQCMHRPTTHTHSARWGRGRTAPSRTTASSCAKTTCKCCTGCSACTWTSGPWSVRERFAHAYTRIHCWPMLRIRGPPVHSCTH